MRANWLMPPATARIAARAALYAAVGRAYDVAIAADDSPEDFAELVEDNGLTVQARAPMTPIVKLVFGIDYDKTRLTEYAAVLAHAHRARLERGQLADYLQSADGGLKGVVVAERRLRRADSGKQVDPVGTMRAKLVAKLRALDGGDFLDDLPMEGEEFALVMVRRMPTGEMVVVGEVPHDVPLLERAARKLVA